MPAGRRPPGEIGKAYQHVLDNYSSLPGPDDLNLLKNGHMLQLYFTNQKSATQTIKVAKETLRCVIRPGQLQSLLKKTIKKFKNLSRGSEMETFSNICCEAYTLYESAAERPQNVEQQAIEPATLRTPTKPVSDEPMPGPSNEPIPESLPEPCSSSRSLRLPMTPRKLLLKRRLDFVSQTKSTMKVKYLKTIKSLRTATDKQIKLKYLKQDINRKKAALKKKDMRFAALKVKFSQATLVQKLNAAQKKVNKLERKNRQLVNAKKTSITASSSDVKMEDAIKLKDQTIRELEDKIMQLEETIVELSKPSSVIEKEGKQYSMDMRLFVYDCIVNSVPTQKIPTVIEQFTKRLGVSVDKIPHRSTIEMMTRELGVVSDYQAAEMLRNGSNLTLGFDATTQEGIHINSIHVTSQEDCQVIGIDQLPGGTAEDYENHIVETIDRVAGVYSAFHDPDDADYDTCRSDMISNITNTMTDRAAVNHATIVRLEGSLGIKLNELNCHLHPLDTIASASRSALKKEEPSALAKKLFGVDCMASQLVLSINKFRYKDGRGDPKGFVTALLNAGLPKGLIPRYRGNRLHILFLTCGKLFVHQEFFSKLFSEGTVSCGGLQASIAHDFSSPISNVELQILGLIGKLLSGPWMRRFYTSKELQISHVDGIDVVKEVLGRIQTCSSSPQETLSMKTDFFGDELTRDNELMKLQHSPVDADLFMTMMKSCLSAIVGVLQKQYSRYFSLNVTEELRKETESARCHNIDAEQVMGMFSAAKDRCPNATLCYISSRIRTTKNRVVGFLDSLPHEKREKLIKFAIKIGRIQRQKKRKRSADILQEISKRLMAKRQKIVTLDRNKLETKLKAKNMKLSDEFPDLDNNTRQDIQDILDGKIVGRRICHIWYDNETQQKIEKVLKKGGGLYVIGYWGEDETYEDDAVDYDIKKYALAADLIYGDLTIA